MGHKMTREGFQADENKVKAILEELIQRLRRRIQDSEEEDHDSTTIGIFQCAEGTRVTSGQQSRRTRRCIDAGRETK